MKGERVRRGGQTSVELLFLKVSKKVQRWEGVDGKSPAATWY
jgi:hypothetical protein